MNTLSENQVTEHGGDQLNAATQDAVGETLSAARPCVLAVDDERSVLSSLRRLFRRESFELVTTSEPADALRILGERKVDVVVSDYRMPGMSGTDLLRKVQENWPETLRLILSGYSEVSAIIAAINDGAIYKFISKPWNDEELKLHVRRALEQSELLRENQRLASELARQNEELRQLNTRLEQYAADTSAGLDSVQELLDYVEAGVITIDVSGLIVGANQRAIALLASVVGGLTGMLASDVLPPELRAVVDGESEERSGISECIGRRLQWRTHAVDASGGSRGMVVTMWEPVP